MTGQNPAPTLDVPNTDALLSVAADFAAAADTTWQVVTAALTATELPDALTYSPGEGILATITTLAQLAPDVDQLIEFAQLLADLRPALLTQLSRNEHLGADQLTGDLSAHLPTGAPGQDQTPHSTPGGTAADPPARPQDPQEETFMATTDENPDPDPYDIDRQDWEPDDGLIAQMIWALRRNGLAEELFATMTEQERRGALAACRRHAARMNAHAAADAAAGEKPIPAPPEAAQDLAPAGGPAALPSYPTPAAKASAGQRGRKATDPRPAPRLDPYNPPEQQAAEAPRPAAAVDLPVTGPHPGQPATTEAPVRMSAQPLATNGWGDGRGQVQYHDDSVLGMAIAAMGPDAHLEIDGAPLANVVGRIATATVQRTSTPQEALDAVKRVRDQLSPGWPGRRALDTAIRKMDAPLTPVPTDTPPPLVRLVQELHAIPLVRRETNRELDPLLQALAEHAGGQLSRSRLQDAVKRLRNRRHESEEGKFAIDAAIEDALQALRTTQR